MKQEKFIMLDADLAEIYGYETKNFNRQVKNTIERFDDDFMFQLSDDEVKECSRCNFFTLNTGRGSNIKYPLRFYRTGHLYADDGLERRSCRSPCSNGIQGIKMERMSSES